MSNSVAISNANTNTNLSASGLVNGTYKAYAVDDAGNLSAASLDNVTIGGLVDIDGNVYRTVVIGTQHWMAENLKVTKYRNGDNITNIDNNSNWSSDTSGAYGVYDNDLAYLDSYGRLYNWYAVDNSSDRYICPEGWRVPTRDEYAVLNTFLGGQSVAGGKMKERGTDHWQSPNSVSDNLSSSGFNARGSGYRLTTGSYSSIKRYSYIWSVTPNGSNAYYRRLKYNTTSYPEYNANKKYGFNVRCLEDN